jgi:mannose-6-phosphate isomerase-like protein (cupin superfamily)
MNTQIVRNNKAKEFRKKLWGSEVWVLNNEHYCLKILTLKKQHSCSLHYHKEKNESFFINEGKVYIEYKDMKNQLENEIKAAILVPGDRIDLSAYTLHRFVGLDDYNGMFEISTHHEDSDSYRENISHKVSDEDFVRYSNYKSE